MNIDGVPVLEEPLRAGCWVCGRVFLAACFVSSGWKVSSGRLVSFQPETPLRILGCLMSYNDLRYLTLESSFRMAIRPFGKLYLLI